jgi:hypothetical protein
LDLSLKDD